MIFKIKVNTEGKWHVPLSSIFSLPLQLQHTFVWETGKNQHLWMLSLCYQRICIHCQNWDHSPYWFFFSGQFESTLTFYQCPRALVKASAVLVLACQALTIVQFTFGPGYNQSLTVQSARLGTLLLTRSAGRVCENQQMQRFYDSQHCSSVSSAPVSAVRISRLVLKLLLFY